MIWRIPALVVAAAILAAASVPVSAQTPCNPVIDGTYCAELPMRSGSSPSRPSSVNLQPIQNIGEALKVNQDSPGTIGTITFRGGSQCIGLMRRGACN